MRRRANSYESTRYSDTGRFPPYVSAADRKRKAAEAIKRAEKRGIRFTPVVVTGRGIASTVWGKAFCDHLETHCDASNRLPRGRTYVRNGSVVHLAVSTGRVDAHVMGSSLYTVEVSFTRLPPARFLIQSRIRIGGRLMCVVRAALPVEIHGGVATVRRRRVLVARPETLVTRPRFEQRAVDSEMLVRE